jgi:vacuolar protein sorting-associated protein 13A/C
MKGPQQAVIAGMSLVNGTAGMAAHTAASASGYLGRITGSINRAIVAGSFDREYIHKKEVRDIKEKPKNTLDGLGKGVLGLGTSVISGVSGLVTQPYQGSKQGAMGLFKGVGMGIAGLFTKPASGVVDLISKTTQGIESGVTGTAECKQSNERLRKPRAFYLALNIIKEYNELDSAIYSHLR